MHFEYLSDHLAPTFWRFDEISDLGNRDHPLTPGPSPRWGEGKVVLSPVPSPQVPLLEVRVIFG